MLLSLPFPSPFCCLARICPCGIVLNFNNDCFGKNVSSGYPVNAKTVTVPQGQNILSASNKLCCCSVLRKTFPTTSVFSMEDCFLLAVDINLIHSSDIAITSRSSQHPSLIQRPAHRHRPVETDLTNVRSYCSQYYY